MSTRSAVPFAFVVVAAACAGPAPEPASLPVVSSAPPVAAAPSTVPSAVVSAPPPAQAPSAVASAVSSAAPSAAPSAAASAKPYKMNLAHPPQWIVDYETWSRKVCACRDFDCFTNAIAAQPRNNADATSDEIAAWTTRYTKALDKVAACTEKIH